VGGNTEGKSVPKASLLNQDAEKAAKRRRRPGTLALLVSARPPPPPTEDSLTAVHSCF
jgi:hypothetical protein